VELPSPPSSLPRVSLPEGQGSSRLSDGYDPHFPLEARQTLSGTNRERVAVPG